MNLKLLLLIKYIRQKTDTDTTSEGHTLYKNKVEWVIKLIYRKYTEWRQKTSSQISYSLLKNMENMAKYWFHIWPYMAIIWIYPNQHTILWNNMELSKLRDHIWLHTPGYKCSPKIIVAFKHLWIWKASQKYLLQMLTKILLPMLTKINPANTHQNIPANTHQNSLIIGWWVAVADKFVFLEVCISYN